MKEDKFKVTPTMEIYKRRLDSVDARRQYVTKNTIHGIPCRPQTPVKNVINGVYELQSVNQLDERYNEIAAMKKRHQSQRRTRHQHLSTKASQLTEIFLAEQRARAAAKDQEQRFTLKRFMNVDSRLKPEWRSRRKTTNDVTATTEKVIATPELPPINA